MRRYGKKSGYVLKVNLVIGILIMVNGNELIVLGEIKVRFFVGNIDCFWLVMVV